MRVYALVLSMLLATNALAETHNVSSMQELQQALTQAASNEEADIIMVAAGTYDFSNNAFWLEYRPAGSPQPPEKYPLTIMGAGMDQTIFDGGGQMGFLYISNDRLRDEGQQNDTGADITISNLTLKDPGPREPLTISTIEANITVNNIKSVAEDCGASGNLVLLNSESGMITLTNSTFAGSQVCNTWAGAVVHSTQSTITVTGCTFAYNDSQKDGVGLLVGANSGSINISGNTFEHNNAYGHSGALQTVIFGPGSVTIAQNTFTDNTGGRGSGVNVQAGQSCPIAVEDNTFTGGGWGAWVESEMGVVNLKDNRFRDYSLGGVKITGAGGQGSATLVNNIFAGLTFGVGAYVQVDAVTVTNNTFTSNAYGLEIRLTGNAAEAEIYNNIIWGSTRVDVNIFDDGPGDGIGAGVELFNNDFSVLNIQVGDNLTQGDNLDVDPQLTADFHLLPSSPVIDMGTDAPGLPNEDFEGDDRTIDANNDGTSEPDMGADESTQYDPGEGGADAGDDGGSDAGTDAGSDAGGDPAGENGDGCGGCSVRAAGSGSAFAQSFAILGLLLVVLRRRRF